MGKQTTLRFICLVAITALIAGALSSCGGGLESPASGNVLALAQNVYINGTKHNASSLEKEHLFFSGTEQTVVEIYFDDNEPVTLNQLVFTAEESDEPAVLGYTVEAVNADDTANDFTLIYKQDALTGTRTCCFNTVTVKALRISITEVAQGSEFNITSLTAHYVPGSYGAGSFGCFAYLDAAAAYNPADLDSGWFEPLTDVIIQGCVQVDDNGKLGFISHNINGTEFDGEQLLAAALVNVRSAALNLNKTLRTHICIQAAPISTEGGASDTLQTTAADTAGAEAQTASSSDTAASTSDAAVPALKERISELLTLYALDGVVFDFTNSYSEQLYDRLSSYITVLDEVLGDKLICMALTKEHMSLSRNADKLLDRVFITGTDSAPLYSYADYSSAVNAFISKGYLPEQLVGVIELYGIPADGGVFRYDFAVEAQLLGKFGNTVTGVAPAADDRCTTRIYNGMCMVYDKTCLLLDKGLGGVCLKNINCDAPAASGLSLSGAVKEAVTARPALEAPAQ